MQAIFELIDRSYSRDWKSIQRGCLYFLAHAPASLSEKQQVEEAVREFTDFLKS